MTYMWSGRLCLCVDANGERDCYCYEAPRCTCDDCAPAADQGRAERLAMYDDDEEL